MTESVVGPVRRRWDMSGVLRIVGLALGALATTIPLLLLLSGSLMDRFDLSRGSLVPTHLTFSNYGEVLVSGKLYTYMLNSLLYVAIAVPASLVLSSMAAFAFARIKFRGRAAIFGSFLAVLMFPISVLFIPMFTVLVSLHLVDTRLGYLLAVVSGTLPLSTFILHRFFRSIPADIEEAARLDGASIWTTFWRICLPLVRPGLAAAGVLALVNVWNEFLLAVVLFRTQGLMPIQQGLTEYSSTDRPDQQLMLAAAMWAIVPVLVVYAFAQRAITSGIMEGSVRG